MEKSVEKANFAKGVSRSRTVFGNQRFSRSSDNASHRLGLFFMFYHLAHQRDTRSDLTLAN